MAGRRLPWTAAGNSSRCRLTKQEPAKDDPTNWSWLDFSNRKFIRLAGPKPPNSVYMITWDTENKKFTLAKFRTPTWSATFTYDLPEPDNARARAVRWTARPSARR